ncbi:MAG: DUF4363 family protein [Clostridiales bacterium]|nr:DUF4363 family protein [Clostridiales bacterium]
MKMFIFSLILMGILTAALIINTIAISYITKNLLEMMDSLPTASGITGSAVELYQIDEFEKKWKKYCFIISLTVPHDELDKIEEQLIALRCAAETLDRDDYHFAYNQLIRRIIHVKDLSATCFNNIL